MDPVISLKHKVSVYTDYSLCIICQTTKIQENCSHLTARGVGTLTSAMQQRRDDVYERLWSCIEDVDYLLSLSPIYHNSCKNGHTSCKNGNNSHQRNQRQLILILCRVVPRGEEPILPTILLINKYALSVINYVIANVVVNSLWFQQLKDSTQST